jgi:hypothetical protein
MRKPVCLVGVRQFHGTISLSICLCSQTRESHIPVWCRLDYDFKNILLCRNTLYTVHYEGDV